MFLQDEAHNRRWFESSPRYQKKKGESVTYWLAFFVACEKLRPVTISVTVFKI